VGIAVSPLPTDTWSGFDRLVGAATAAGTYVGLTLSLVLFCC